jgi:farnesyl-diphosphate farnesyltransferase
MAFSFTVSSSQTAYLNTLMNKVSRSFALVVPHLEPPLNHIMATAYLLCRVVDNIEDCFQPTSWKKQRFAEFEQLLDQPNLASDILLTWQQESWPCLTIAERQLIKVDDGQPLWQIYAAIPAEYQAIIHQWTLTMITGMRQLEDQAKKPHFIRRNGAQMPATAADYNSYCYYVAGTVGHMSTELVIRHYGLNGKVANRLRQTCEACGRGLQKTNIVKGFAEDLGRGISYLPLTWLQEADYTPLALRGASPQWTQKVLGDVTAELQLATEHVLVLPSEATGYRMAGLLCLLPAYETLMLAAQ